MSTPLVLALGFGGGLGVAMLFHLLACRRVPPPPPAPRSAATTSPARMPARVPAAPSAEREVAAVWLQFLRREVADTVGAINTRLAVVKTLLAELEADARGVGRPRKGPSGTPA